EPSPDAGEVEARQRLTAEAVALLDAAVEPALAGISDIAPFADRAEREGVLGPGELRLVATSVRVAVAAREALASQRELAPLLAEIATAIEPSLIRVADDVDRCVEEDGSDLRDTASPLLRRLRT